MYGQWIGTYSGTNQGMFVFDVDDGPTHDEGFAVVLDSNPDFPPSVAYFEEIPKEERTFKRNAVIFPIDRRTGLAASWDQIKDQYAKNIRVPTTATAEFKVAGKHIDVNWQTDIGTHGAGTVYKSQSGEPSELVPLANVKSWDEFRKFARELEPYWHVFRGQRTNNARVEFDGYNSRGPFSWH